MPETTTQLDINEDLEAMYEAGAHYGQSKSRRHPSTIPYIYGTKNKMEIFDLEKTKEALAEAEEYVKELGRKGKKLLFVTSKPEANKTIREAAESVDQPYVTGRWIGGTLTNFKNIRGRIEKLRELRKKRESGELEKYTKKEQLLLEREIERLERKFGGIEDMSQFPGALFIVDTKEEQIAVDEATQVDVSIVGLCNTDCNIDEIDYPVPANDTTKASIEYFVNRIVEAYREGQKEFTPVEDEDETEESE